MISVERREEIRRAYFVDNKSMRQIAREFECSRDTVTKAVESAEPATYTLKQPRPAPVLGSYMARIDELLAENERLPRKQRYTGHTIYKDIQVKGYQGSESRVRGYIAERRQEQKKRQVYIPLEFDPGSDAQVAFSRFLSSFFFTSDPQRPHLSPGAHTDYLYITGVPRRISYDNLKTAVQRVLKGRNRKEQDAFIFFRSYHLFDSHFCTPGQGHEKGRVEDGVGFARRNFLVPLPETGSFQELNAHLLAQCLADDQRRVDRQTMTMGEAWEMERPYLRALPKKDFECCITKPATLNGYSQVEFDTNRYSVPADEAYRNLVLKAYPFRVDILHLNDVLASHPRCYGQKQDILDPLHYLPLLEQRPGAFDHAVPIRRWRKTWPPVYERLLARLQDQWPDGRGVREFVRILKLHRDHPADRVAQAIGQALEYGCAHGDGVQLCLHQLLNPEAPVPPLDLTDWPQLATVGAQPPDLNRYDQLLEGA